MTTRSLGLLVVALALIAIMVVLGRWQYEAYDDHQRDDARAAAAQPPIPLDDALGPDEAFHGDAVGRPVTVAGQYRPEQQIYVTDFDGSSQRFAVVTPMVTSSGAAILVVRGSSETPGAPAPTGTVEVEGILQPSSDEGTALDSQRVTDAIRTASLVGSFDQDLYSGYVVMSASSPADSLRPVDPPLPDPSRWAGMRNLVYALQWWLFAAFVAFMWWRIAHDAEQGSSTPVG